MRRAVVLLIALPTLGAAFAVAAPLVETASYMTPSGVSSLIGEHARWNDMCRAFDAPPVTLERAAIHGSICVRHDLIAPVQSRSGRAVNCIGRRLNGVLIIYRPQANFVGTDSVRYGLDFPEGRVSREINIDIQQSTGAAPDFFLGIPATAARAGDRVPECAGESS